MNMNEIAHDYEAGPAGCVHCGLGENAAVHQDTVQKVVDKLKAVELCDWRKVPIRVGSLIVYVVRHGSSVECVEGTVTEVGTHTRYGRREPLLKVRPARSTSAWHTRRDKDVTLTALGTVTVLL